MAAVHGVPLLDQVPQLWGSPSRGPAHLLWNTNSPYWGLTGARCRASSSALLADARAASCSRAAYGGGQVMHSREEEALRWGVLLADARAASCSMQQRTSSPTNKAASTIMTAASRSASVLMAQAATHVWHRHLAAVAAGSRAVPGCSPRAASSADNGSAMLALHFLQIDKTSWACCTLLCKRQPEKAYVPMNAPERTASHNAPRTHCACVQHQNMATLHWQPLEAPHRQLVCSSTKMAATLTAHPRGAPGRQPALVTQQAMTQCHSLLPPSVGLHPTSRVPDYFTASPTAPHTSCCRA